MTHADTLLNDLITNEEIHYNQVQTYEGSIQELKEMSIQFHRLFTIYSELLKSEY